MQTFRRESSPVSRPARVESSAHRARNRLTQLEREFGQAGKNNIGMGPSKCALALRSAGSLALLVAAVTVAAAQRTSPQFNLPAPGGNQFDGLPDGNLFDQSAAHSQDLAPLAPNSAPPPPGLVQFSSSSPAQQSFASALQAQFAAAQSSALSGQSSFQPFLPVQSQSQPGSTQIGSQLLPAQPPAPLPLEQRPAQQQQQQPPPPQQAELSHSSQQQQPQLSLISRPSLALSSFSQSAPSHSAAQVTGHASSGRQIASSQASAPQVVASSTVASIAPASSSSSGSPTRRQASQRAAAAAAQTAAPRPASKPASSSRQQQAALSGAANGQLESVAARRQEASQASLAAAASSQSFQCPDSFGFYRHHKSCDKYWACENGTATLKLCGNGLMFEDSDPKRENCAYPFSVDCGSDRTDLEPPISTPNCPRLYGLFSDPNNCRVFYSCWNGEASKYECPPGLAYDSEQRVCVWADLVDRCAQSEVSDGFVCPDASEVDQPGHYTRHAHPTDCRKFYVCIEATARPYGCSFGTVFNVDSLQCDEPESVSGCEKYYGDLDPKLAKKLARENSSGQSTSSSSNNNSNNNNNNNLGRT